MKELSSELQNIDDKRKKLDDLVERMLNALSKSEEWKLIERNKL
jgi:tetrahydromethanopterin S-methyltransferase subunit B